MEEDRNENIFQSPPEYHSRLSRPKNGQSPIKKIITIILFIIIIGIIFFGAFRLITGGESETTANTSPSPTIESFPTDVPESTPEDKEEDDKDPTPTPEDKEEESDSDVDRSDLSIHVLNGNGVAGASSKASDYLEGLGYNVIQIGNAENFDYAEVEIQIKKSQVKYLDQLEADLAKEYEVGTSTSNLGESETPDAVVIIGGE